MTCITSCCCHRPGLFSITLPRTPSPPLTPQPVGPHTTTMAGWVSARGDLGRALDDGSVIIYHYYCPFLCCCHHGYYDFISPLLLFHEVIATRLTARRKEAEGEGGGAFKGAGSGARWLRAPSISSGSGWRCLFGRTRRRCRERSCPRCRIRTRRRRWPVSDSVWPPAPLFLRWALRSRLSAGQLRLLSPPFGSPPSSSSAPGGVEALARRAGSSVASQAPPLPRGTELPVKAFGVKGMSLVSRCFAVWGPFLASRWYLRLRRRGALVPACHRRDGLALVSPRPGTWGGRRLDTGPLRAAWWGQEAEPPGCSGSLSLLPQPRAGGSCQPWTLGGTRCPAGRWVAVEGWPGQERAVSWPH